MWYEILIYKLGAQCNVIVSALERDDDGDGFDVGGCDTRALVYVIHLVAYP